MSPRPCRLIRFILGYTQRPSEMDPPSRKHYRQVKAAYNRQPSGPARELYLDHLQRTKIMIAEMQASGVVPTVPPTTP